MSLLQAILLLQLYVFLKSWNDSIYINNRKVIPTHGLEWLQIAVVSTICAIGYSHSLWVIVAFNILQAAICWIIQDLELNAFLGHWRKLFTYIGSGGIDNFFKFHWPTNTWRPMWIAKLALLAVSAGLLFWMVRK